MAGGERPGQKPGCRQELFPMFFAWVLLKGEDGSSSFGDLMGFGR